MRSTCQSRCLEREVIDGVLAQPSSRWVGWLFPVASPWFQNAHSELPRHWNFAAGGLTFLPTPGVCTLLIPTG